LSAEGERATMPGGGPARGLRPEPIRVVIADDHALFRRGLEMVLDEETDIELVGQAGDGAEAVKAAGELLPDIVLMDIRMPKISGIEAGRKKKKKKKVKKMKQIKKKISIRKNT